MFLMSVALLPQVVHFEPPVAPHPFAAEAALSKLATDPGVVACMVCFKWTVGKLAEMDPADDKLKQEVRRGHTRQALWALRGKGDWERPVG